VIRSVNIGREPTTFGSKPSDILIEDSEIAGVQNHYWDGRGLLQRSLLELLGRSVSPMAGVLEEYT
jgi:hypothetical protein